MPRVECSVKIQGSAKVAYEIASDMESYPFYMENVESVQILERSENRTVTKWQTKVDGRRIGWIEEDSFDGDNLRIDYRLIKGDLRKFEGYWHFLQEGSEVRAELIVEFDLGIPVLATLINPLLKQKTYENSMAMLGAIKEQVELQQEQTSNSGTP